MKYAPRTRNRTQRGRKPPARKSMNSSHCHTYIHKCKAVLKGENMKFGLRDALLFTKTLSKCVSFDLARYINMKENKLWSERAFSLFLSSGVFTYLFMCAARSQRTYMGRRIWQSLFFHVCVLTKTWKSIFIHTTAVSQNGWNKNGIRVGWVHSQNWRKHHGPLQKTATLLLVISLSFCYLTRNSSQCLCYLFAIIQFRPCFTSRELLT